VPNRSSLVIVAVAAALGLLVVIVGVSPQVRAGPPPPVTFLDPASVRGAGKTIALSVRTVDGVPLVEPQRPIGAPPLRALAASPDGRAVVIGNLERGQVGPLTIARADGSQLEVALPGVRGAAFDALGAWLAVVDLTGALWRVDVQTGAATHLADGPFGSEPAILPDGSILAVRLSSVDAPTWAAGVTVDSVSGAETPVLPSPEAHDQLVYQAVPLADGSVALVRHRTGGGVAVVRAAPDGSEASLADLNDASGVAVSPDAGWVAWTAAGQVRIASTGPDPVVRDLGAGTGVRFSPDGSLLLVFSAERSLVMDRAGRHLAETGISACWLGDGRGCQP